jgi:hypothetical protein
LRTPACIPASLLLVALAVAPSIADAQKAASAEALAATPAMGWNSWNFFAKNVTDKDIRAAADNVIATGMKDAGYIYVNIDDSWQGERDANGVLHANSKFPDMKALADYVYSKALKIGIYSGPGTKTCGGYAGTLGHEEQDAKMYAERIDAIRSSTSVPTDHRSDLYQESSPFRWPVSASHPPPVRRIGRGRGDAGKQDNALTNYRFGGRLRSGSG